jgi:SRSO17 transposase
MTTVTTPAPDAVRRLEDWLEPFRPEFRRRDRLHAAALYLRGLLAPGPRKTVEGLARLLADETGQDGDGLAQSLLHFLKDSPWDEDAVWRRLHARLARRLGGGLLVLDELTFLKQGRHSVGVQRQLSRSLGRKASCQIAVALYHLGPGTFLPLSLRLYLPRGWLRDAARLDAAAVPPAGRQPADKLALARDLLAAAADAGLTADAVAAGPSLGEVPEEFVAELSRRRLSWQGALTAEQGERVRRGLEELCLERGLDHFEGRSWRGFHHHACLVTLAETFRQVVDC